MGNKLTAAVSIAALLTGMSLSALAADPAGQVTIFNTKDYTKDRALWSTPEYWRFNTPGQMGGMALNIVPYEAGGQVGGARLYGSKGTGVPGKTNLASPYPYKTAMEQFNDWKAKAKGGTKHTQADLPNWTGNWMGGGGGGGGGGGPVSDMMKYLQPKYQQYYVQEEKAAAEGRGWSASGQCLPGGFFGMTGFDELVLTPKVMYTMGAAANDSNHMRWIYIDAPHAAPNLQFPKWGGESVAFWDGDALIVHTNQIRGWRGGPGGEFTDDLETVEKWEGNGDTLSVDMTIYDPAVFTGPIHTKSNYRKAKELKPEDRPLFNTCSDTQGPSPKVFLNANGFLDEHINGDPGFTWEVSDPRPWGTWADASDKRYQTYLAKGGKPPKAADVTPPPTYTETRGRKGAD